MKLQFATWEEVDAYLGHSGGIIVPAGSTEQHGPIGLIGTDALCAEDIAIAAATRADALVAPTLAYSPAPFNMAFAGTVSLSTETFKKMAEEVFGALSSHGFHHIYVLNGHGANLAPLRSIRVANAQIRIRSWWDFEVVNEIRDALYGEWEGMHATPSEISITQANHRIVDLAPPSRPDAPLTAEFMKAHAGDRHGPAKEHRAQFPDGRVGSDSALASPEHGKKLLEAAAQAVAQDYKSFLQS